GPLRERAESIRERPGRKWDRLWRCGRANQANLEADKQRVRQQDGGRRRETDAQVVVDATDNRFGDRSGGHSRGGDDQGLNRRGGRSDRFDVVRLAPVDDRSHRRSNEEEADKARNRLFWIPGKA